MSSNRNVVEETLDLINNLFRSKLNGDLNAMEFTMSRKEVADILNHVKMSIANNCVAIPDGLHPDTRELVLNFAGKMAKKLHKAQIKYGFTNGWRHPNWDSAKGNDQFSNPTQCLIAFSHHIDKGDPVDVANYCAFMDWHGWQTKYLSTHQTTKDKKEVRIVSETGYGTDYVGSRGEMPQ